MSYNTMTHPYIESECINIMQAHIRAETEDGMQRASWTQGHVLAPLKSHNAVTVTTFDTLQCDWNHV